MQQDKKYKFVLFICPYPFDIAPGQRFRYELYLDQLESYNIKYQCCSFLDENTNKILFEEGTYFKKGLGVIKGFFRRIRLLFRISKYDYIFIFREAAPVGPPIIEWIIGKVLKKKIVYDFDDAIWLPFKSEANKITNAFKWTSKVGSICKWSHAVICGNEYLAKYARVHNDNVVVIPTIVDTLEKHNQIKNQNTPKVTIGWTGSHSTNQYLSLVLPVLTELQQTYGIQLIFISSVDPELDGIDYRFIRWNKQKEVDDLLAMNIGIMPLTDDEWAKGKCGFKAIQYLSLGIPAVVSPIGVNKEIVIDGENGLWASNNQEWKERLEQLILGEMLRSNMGKVGRIHIVRNYSKSATLDKFIQVFNG